MSLIQVLLVITSNLIQEGIRTTLQEYEDISVVGTASLSDRPEKVIDTLVPHIILIEVSDPQGQEIPFIQQISSKYSRIKTLSIGSHLHKDIIYKAIKAGSNGFVPYNIAKEELIQAIYTLRNGHDYYSHSISHLLINDWIRHNEAQWISNQEMSKLSEREVEILKLWGKSYTNQEISDRLCISRRTVESHKNHIMQKLRLKTTVDLIKFAVRNNIINIEDT